MKHIKLFEAFVNEAMNPAATKLVDAFNNINDNIEAGAGEVQAKGNAVLFTIAPEFESDMLEIVVDMKLKGYDKYTTALELMQDDDDSYEDEMEGFEARKFALELLMNAFKKANVGYIIDQDGSLGDMPDTMKNVESQEVFVGKMIGVEPYGFSILGAIKTGVDKKANVDDILTKEDLKNMKACQQAADSSDYEFEIEGL
jgi:hypothetical protein